LPTVAEKRSDGSDAADLRVLLSADEQSSIYEGHVEIAVGDILCVFHMQGSLWTVSRLAPRLTSISKEVSG